MNGFNQVQRFKEIAVMGKISGFEDRAERWSRVLKRQEEAEETAGRAFGAS